MSLRPCNQRVMAVYIGLKNPTQIYTKTRKRTQ
nr:MAG TPA: Protein PB1-F2-apoptotic mitochondrial targeting protein, VIRAL [Caudoviricetes sp.]